MPPPKPVNLIIETDGVSCLWLPELQQIKPFTVPEPANDNPLPDFPMHAEETVRRTVEHDPVSGETIYRVIDDGGEMEIPYHGMRIRHYYEETWFIHPDDPCSNRATSHHVYSMRRGDWSIRTETRSEFHCDEEHFYLSAEVLAYEGDSLFNRREWPETAIARDHL